MLCCGLLLTANVVARSPETDLAQLIDRVPGHHYKVGAAKISAWKERRRAGQGAAFSEKDFHASVLRHGRLPLLVLDRS